MTEPCLLAIDQGTTGSTVLVIGASGTVLGRGYSEFTQHYPQPGWVEHDAEEIWTTTHKVVAEALSDAGITANELSGIGITNQRETSVVWDRAAGRPVARAIVWQDRRTADLCDALKQEGLEADWQARTGLLIDPYFSGTKLRWLLDEVPDLRLRAEAGELAFGTIDSWLVAKLTGGRVHITDYTNASRTLLYNIRELCWDDVILDRLEIPKAVLPDVKPSSQIYGETDPQAFFGASIPVAGIAGDQQAALFGQTCYEPGQAKNTYGTGSFLLLNTGTQAIASQQRLLTTIAWGVDDTPVEYALEGAIFITGAAIQWLRDGLGIIDSAAESEILATSIDANDDVYFVPALAGLGAPYWDPYARGTLVGLTRGTTREHIARAALEAICYQTRDVADAMTREAGIELSELRADGGAVTNRFLMQFQSDLLGVPLEVPEITETTALGAAYLAGLATGIWSDREELRAQWRRRDSYEPSMAADERDRLYRRWQAAVERSRGWAS
jgi:glycerol kinase